MPTNARMQRTAGTRASATTTSSELSLPGRSGVAVDRISQPLAEIAPLLSHVQVLHPSAHSQLSPLALLLSASQHTLSSLPGPAVHAPLVKAHPASAHAVQLSMSTHSLVCRRCAREVLSGSSPTEAKIRGNTIIMHQQSLGRARCGATTCGSMTHKYVLPQLTSLLLRLPLLLPCLLQAA